MSDLLEDVQRELWAPAGIDQQDVEKLLQRLSNRAINLGELFFQHQRAESWSLEDEIVKEGSFRSPVGKP